MSQQSRTNKPDRRRPGAHATTRLSASGPGPQVVSARDVAIFFREDCRTLDDSLQLEMVVAQYCIQIRDVRSTNGVPVGDAVAADVVAHLEREGDALSHAVLRGMAHIGVGLAAERSAAAAARLSEADAGLPPQFVDVAKASPVGAVRVRDVRIRECSALFAEFEHPLGRRHTIALFLDERRAKWVKHIALLGPLEEVRPEEEFAPATPEAVPTAPTGALMRDALERSYGRGAARSGDYRALIALARAESMESGVGAARVTAY